MVVSKYLKRIGFEAPLFSDINTLKAVHKCHLLAVPFENLDIQNGVAIRLELPYLFSKVVTNNRGGFCYELNYLFCQLLTTLGFDAHIIAARIFDNGRIGPEFDHMALLVKNSETLYLADVGFGNLFLYPLQINLPEVQFDGLNFFRVLPQGADFFLLQMSKNGTDFQKKYAFDLKPREIGDFQEQCYLKQFSAQSYFVKNKLVTKATSNGRKTIRNGKFMSIADKVKTEKQIENENEERAICKMEFNLNI